MYIMRMVRTQIQLPDSLYRKARDLASQREISMAELLRRGLEYMLSTAGSPCGEAEQWSLPEGHDLGGRDPFAATDWRLKIHMGEQLAVAEESPKYGAEEQVQ